MRRSFVLAAMLPAFLALGLGMGAEAQTHVGKDAYQGLHWSVAAPQGASWTLVCRFRPVTVWVSPYERDRWMNIMTQDGRGSRHGRLPGDNGRCSLTKTGGEGSVGIALVKNGMATSAGTRDQANPAKVTVF
ncbi:MAG: hypothetical protein KJ805_04120 [Alphaproteobacteria bacterium]|nr:hypothetical protein [Alphaproteobacteria bacterium]